jgi:CRISPR/Cas system CSM-associated protein Csm3 (group 7 of RAMP superfamily)
MDLSTADGLMEFLRQTDDRWAGAPVEADWLNSLLAAARTRLVAAPADNPHVARGFAAATLRLEADGPFLINDATHAIWSGFDHAPVLTRLVDGLPVLPGSGLRGVLRAQAERIARTLATAYAEDAEAYRVTCPACDPLAARRPGERGIPGESCDSLLRHEPGREDDVEVGEADLCLACRLFGCPQMGSRLLIEDGMFVAQAQPEGAAAGIDGLRVAHKPQDFLAIDRFTGGARHGAKFDAEALWKPVFETRLRLDNPRPWELGWLLLVLRDVHEGRVSVGFGGAKGFGRLRVAHWTLAIGRLTEDDFPLDPGVVGASQTMSGVHTVSSAGHADGDLCEPLREPAGAWVAEFHAKVQTFRREGLPSLPDDSYFGTDAAVLYPLRGDVHG